MLEASFHVFRARVHQNTVFVWVSAQRSGQMFRHFGGK